MPHVLGVPHQQVMTVMTVFSPLDYFWYTIRSSLLARHDERSFVQRHATVLHRLYKVYERIYIVVRLVLVWFTLGIVTPYP